MKILKEILRTLKVISCIGSADVEVAAVRSDSRKVEKGDLFVATVGTKVDGHDFIPSVIEKGAAAIVCEKMPEQCVENVVYVQVEDANEALGRLASAWYDYPSSHLCLVGYEWKDDDCYVALSTFWPFRSSLWIAFDCLQLCA